MLVLNPKEFSYRMYPCRFILVRNKYKVLNYSSQRFKMNHLRLIKVKLKYPPPTQKTNMALRPILGSFIFLVPSKINLLFEQKKPL